MLKEKFQALLIEDDPDHILLIKNELSKIKNADISLRCAGNVTLGLAELAKGTFDVLLLDLNLPDSAGLDTLIRVRKVFPNLPIIVLTSSDDESSALESVHNGAQDYLVKGLEAQHLLGRSIRYAIERQRLLVELDDIRQREREAREINSIEALSHSDSSSVTAGLYGQFSLRQSAPALFLEMVCQYEALLDDALEQHAFRVENKVSPGLRELAERLRFCKATARDVIDIHTTAFKRKSLPVVALKRQAYLDEGRLMVVELMGNLLMGYRNYYSASPFGNKNKEK